MQKRHQALLIANHEFLVSEIPMDATLEAIREKRILTWHDFEQLKTLRHQGRKALARYFLAVLPQRGPKAFHALLESLQEANAQHLVDLLLQQAGAMNLDDLFKTPEPPRSPSDTPLPPGPDPNEYAVRLMRNAKYIREFVDPADISPVLTQNKVITPREADMVLHIHGRNKKWDLLLAALLQRGERAYQAFMAALLQKGYSAVFHTIQETTTEPSGSDEDSDHYGDSNDDILESDEEVKAETSTSWKRNSVADNLLKDANSRQNWSRADETLLARSGDLQAADPGFNLMSNTSRWEDTENYVSQAGSDWDATNERTNGKHEAQRRGSRRKSNGGNLNSVQEES
ncbi:unnamed protein product [Lymnaea stagnalis]|uniref:CARD domain-containing protein n=1 Tax=Lymnaea stagnalis TaxID=6523 RepID=A0AAV2H5M1_LYMST